jgi:hypothetical protein
VPAAAAAAVLAAPAVSSSCGGRGSRGGGGGRVAWAGGLVGEFSGLYSLLLTTHMLIFARRVCLGASLVLGGANASYCCSSLAIGRAILRGGGEIGGGRGCRVVFFF